MELLSLQHHKFVSTTHKVKHILQNTIWIIWIFKKWDVGVWTGLGWLRIETVGGTCECGNELSGSIKSRVFLD
jgi:hypothetical protein